MAEEPSKWAGIHSNVTGATSIFRYLEQAIRGLPNGCIDADFCVFPLTWSDMLILHLARKKRANAGYYLEAKL